MWRVLRLGVDSKKFMLYIKYVHHRVLHYLKFNEEKRKTKIDFITLPIDSSELPRSKISYFITHPRENCIFQTGEACLIIHFISFGWTSFRTFTPRDTIANSFSLSSFNIPLTLRSVIWLLCRAHKNEREGFQLGIRSLLFYSFVPRLFSTRVKQCVCDFNFE